MRPTVRAALVFVPLLLAAATAPARADEGGAATGIGAGTDDLSPWSSPYVYQNAGRGQEMSVTLQYEAGYGSRESRNLAQDGVEQGLRARFQPWSFLGVEAFGGVVLDGHGGGYKSYAAGVEVIGRVLEQSRHYVNLDLGAGYLYDYRHNHVPRVRLTLGHSFDRLDLSVSGLMEIPVGAAGRDALDVMTSVALSYGILDWLRIGGEVAVEDMEGFWEPGEAEGGAKLLFGPTFAFTLPYGLFLKLNASPVYAYTGNRAPGPGVAASDTWGFMGRAMLGWTWH